MYRLNHHHLYIFWTLAKKNSFTETSKELSIAQSAVTSQIKNLEELLGLELIDRSRRGKIELTEAGSKVFEFAENIFETGNELLKWAYHGATPKKQIIRIGALSGLSRNLQFEFLKPLIGNPDIKIQITTGDKENLSKLLCDHSLDIILSSQRIQIEGKSSFHSHVLTKSPIVFVKSAADLNQSTDLVEILSKRPLYIPGHNLEVRPELDAFFESMRISPTILGEIDDVALLRIFALRSKEIVALPLLGVKDDIEEKKLQVLGNAGRIEQKFYAITRKKKFPNPLIEKLIAEARSISFSRET
ncbi:MAG: LysR family transcriptional regulator [Bdellovibrio sp.]